LGETLGQYRGVITGVPELRGVRLPPYPGLTEQETAVMQALVVLKEAAAEGWRMRPACRKVRWREPWRAWWS